MSRFRGSSARRTCSIIRCSIFMCTVCVFPSPSVFLYALWFTQILTQRSYIIVQSILVPQYTCDAQHTSHLKDQSWPWLRKSVLFRWTFGHDLTIFLYCKWPLFLWSRILLVKANQNGNELFRMKYPFGDGPEDVQKAGGAPECYTGYNLLARTLKCYLLVGAFIVIHSYTQEGKC